MDRRLFLAGIAAITCSSCSTMSKLNPFKKSTGEPLEVKSKPKTEEQRGYVNLFPSDNLENWVVMGKPEGWSIKSGILRSEGGKGGNWLRSKKEYSDFIIRLEYRVSANGNSGVFFRCTEQGEGYECQISNEQPPRDELHCTGSLYGLVPASPRPSEAPDTWHTYEIRCINKRITVEVDGLKTVDVSMDAVPAIQNKPMKGFVGLQDSHTGEGCWVEYRNVRIRELIR